MVKCRGKTFRLALHKYRKSNMHKSQMENHISNGKRFASDWLRHKARISLGTFSVCIYLKISLETSQFENKGRIYTRESDYSKSTLIVPMIVTPHMKFASNRYLILGIHILWFSLPFSRMNTGRKER
jgi:hypothetical protein